MRRFFRGFSRYRPRLWTLALLTLTAALLTFSNLSAEQSLPEDDWRAFGHKSYGWPLIWHRYVLWDRYTEGWYLSRSRLATNLAIWLLILVVPAGTCEWLLRRHRLRLRWSLRTMLAAIGLAALGCGWFIDARDRANIEDALIAAINERGTVWVERWGPRWLDLFGADRFRRRIVSVSLNYSGYEEDDPQILKQVAHLRGLRHLSLCPDEWPLEPGLADALALLPGLRSLCIEGAPAREWHAAVGKLCHLERLSVAYDADLCTSLERLPNLKSLAVSGCNDVEDSHRLLTAVGKLKNLEQLRLERMPVRGSSLACLSGLTELRFLSLSSVGSNEGGWLGTLPPLARVEAIDLEGSEVGHSDVAFSGEPTTIEIAQPRTDARHRPRSTPIGVGGVTGRADDQLSIDTPLGARRVVGHRAPA